MSLAELEDQLAKLTHGDEALRRVQAFAQPLSRQERALAFRDLAIPPVDHADALRRKVIPEEEDRFSLLQGDVVHSDAIYHLGERQVGQLHMIANATCDLVPGRRELAVLLPVTPIYRHQTDAKAVLGELLSFRSNRRMYLPPLSDDPDLVGHAVQFDQLASARLADLLLAQRIASLSLVGWRVLGSHLQAFFTRCSPSEVQLRRTYSAS